MIVLVEGGEKTSWLDSGVAIFCELCEYVDEIFFEEVVSLKDGEQCGDFGLEDVPALLWVFCTF